MADIAAAQATTAGMVFMAKIGDQIVTFPEKREIPLRHRGKVD